MKHPPVRPDREIVELILREVGVDPENFVGKARSPRAVLARGLCSWLMRETTSMSFPEIANVVCPGRSHSTVIGAVQRTARLIESGEDVPKMPGVTALAFVERLLPLALKIQGTRPNPKSTFKVIDSGGFSATDNLP